MTDLCRSYCSDHPFFDINYSGCDSLSSSYPQCPCQSYGEDVDFDSYIYLNSYYLVAHSENFVPILRNLDSILFEGGGHTKMLSNCGKGRQYLIDSSLCWMKMVCS